MANALTLKSPTLKSPLAANASVNEDDVIAAKTQLMNLGLYEVPEWGITGVPDRALFDAIRTFQKGTQLKTDGVMKPGGETETTLKTAAELVRRQGRNGDTILAHISPAEADLLHRVTDGGSINPETGLPEFFLGSMLGGLASSFVGSFAGPAAGSLVGSALSSFAAPVIDKYVSKKVGKKIGGPLGEIAGNTLGGYLGSGSLADIGGGLGQSFGNAVGGYAKRKVSQKIGGPLGDNIGDMLGSNLSGAVGGVASNGLTNAFGLEAKPTSQPTAQPVSSPISDGVKDLLNPDYSSARTPGINPRDSRQSTARPTASTAPTLGTPTLGSPARTSPSKPQPQQQTPWLPPLLASEPRANIMEIKSDTPRPRAQTMEIKGKRPSLDLPAETILSNARTADALMKTSNFSAIKPHIQEAWTNGGEQGRAEVVNLAQQMKDRNPEHGAKFEQDMGLKGTDALDFGPNPLDEIIRIGASVQVADNSADAFKHLKGYQYPPYQPPSEAKGLNPFDKQNKTPDGEPYRFKAGEDIEGQKLPPAMVSPTQSGKVRGIDGSAKQGGEWGVRRTDKADNNYHHRGVDYVAEPGEDIKSTVSGKVERIGDPYGDGKYKLIEVRTPDGYIVRHLYVSPNVKIGDDVVAGKTSLGQAQNVAKGKSNMTNHVHVEVREPLISAYKKSGDLRFKDIKPQLMK